MRPVILIAAVVLTTGVFVGHTGCQRSEDRYLKRAVRAEEIEGEWVMNPASVKDLRDVGYTSPIDPLQHTITLRADGTCHFHTFPSALTAQGTSNPSVDRRCRWTVRESVGRQALLIDLIDEPSFVTRYHFSDHDGTMVLWQHADDPDAWRYVEYLKR